jgi:hypothetical protein
MKDELTKLMKIFARMEKSRTGPDCKHHTQMIEKVLFFWFFITIKLCKPLKTIALCLTAVIVIFVTIKGSRKK